MNKIAKITISFLIISVSFMLFFAINLKADYIYTPWLDTIESANSMEITRVVDNSNFVDSLGNQATYKFDEISDVFYYKDKIYISDNKLNKILVLDSNFRHIDTFPDRNDSNYQLNEPKGIFIFKDNLYIADSLNKRVVVFDLNTKDLVKEVKNPEDVIFNQENKKVDFKPLKVVVDRTGRILVIAHNIFEGIMEFDQDGKFNRYFGTNKVRLSFFEQLLSFFATQEQKDKLQLKLQTSFTNIDIDSNDYLYVVSQNEQTTPIQKMNFKGRNILKANSYVPITGDIKYPDKTKKVPNGPSVFVDIASNKDNNRLIALDKNQGRIFAYDRYGNLLYIFGKKGSLSTEFNDPVALTYINDNIVVADKKKLIVYKPTEFAELINQAVVKYEEMDYVESERLWNEVLSKNSNYFLAYSGIGRIYLRNGKYYEAMANLKLGYDKYNYSKAYEQYRNQKISKILPYVIGTVLVLVGFGIIRTIYVAVKKEKEN